MEIIKKIIKNNYSTINAYTVYAGDRVAFSRIGTKRSACERAGIDFQQARTLDYMVYGWLGSKYICVMLRDYKSARQLFDAMAAQPATTES